MKIVYALIKILILLVFILLAVSNIQSTAFHYLPGQEMTLPLIVLLLLFFVVGTIFGVLAMLRRLLSLRNEVNRLRREIRKSGRVAEVTSTANTNVGTTVTAAHNKG